jgi:hypothetical protein
MAGLTHSIGSHTFLSLEGSPGVYRTKVELLSLPYKDGESQRSMGRHNEPFTLQSCVDLSSYTAARNKLDDYALLIGAGVQTLVWRSVNFTSGLTTAMEVFVLDVQQDRIVVANNVVGGLNVSTGSNGVMLYANWTLIGDRA